eukprot:354903-Chlamydomonas_euryale.AAC.41
MPKLQKTICSGACGAYDGAPGGGCAPATGCGVPCAAAAAAAAAEFIEPGIDCPTEANDVRGGPAAVAAALCGAPGQPGRGVVAPACANPGIGMGYALGNGAAARPSLRAPCHSLRAPCLRERRHSLRERRHSLRERRHGLRERRRSRQQSRVRAGRTSRGSGLWAANSSPAAPAPSRAVRACRTAGSAAAAPRALTRAQTLAAPRRCRGRARALGRTCSTPRRRRSHSQSHRRRGAARRAARARHCHAAPQCGGRGRSDRAPRPRRARGWGLLSRASLRTPTHTCARQQ